jgi:hypothetical protein
VKKEQQEFHIEEFKQLRIEIAGLIARIETLGKYSLAVAAAVYSWLVTQSLGVTSYGVICTKLGKTITLVSYSWYIPFAVALLAGLMGLVAFLRVLDMGAYLARLESALGHSLLGGEKFFAKKPWIISATTCLTWVALLVGTATVGWLMAHQSAQAPACEKPVVKSADADH